MYFKADYYFKFISLLISIVTFNLTGVSAFNDDTDTGAFMPDSNVMKLAQKFDRKYFPLFLKALEEIESGDTTLIAEFFSQHFEYDTIILRLPSFDDFETPIVPIFRNHTENKNYTIPFPIKWVNPNYPDPSWNLWFKSLRWLKPYINSQNFDTVMMAFKVINDYVISHTVYPDINSRFTFGDHASTDRLGTLINAYHRFKDMRIYQTIFQNRLINSILSHIFYLASLDHYSTWTNHAIIVDNGLIESLQNLPEFKKRSEFVEFAFLRVFEQYRFSYTTEGIHKEHSPCYHIFVTNKLNKTISDAMELGVNIPDDILSLQSIANYYLRFIQNSHHSFPIGSCERKIYKPRSENEFIHGYQVYPESGWAFLKDSTLNLSIITQSRFHSLGHYHQDETSFILNVNGNEMIIDPGLFSHNKSSPFYAYMHLSNAHNVLVVDGKNFNSKLENTGLSGITRYFQDSTAVNSSNGIVELTHPHYLDMGTEIHRQLAFAGNNTIIVKDIIKSDSVRNYSQQFHLAPGATITRNRKNLFVHWDHHPYFLKISGNIKYYKVIEGQMDPFQGWYFPVFNQAASCPLLVLRRHGKNMIFTTKIEVFKVGIEEKKLKANRREIIKLFNHLERKERSQLMHEPFPQRWRPTRD